VLPPRNQFRILRRSNKRVISVRLSPTEVSLSIRAAIRNDKLETSDEIISVSQVNSGRR